MPTGRLLSKTVSTDKSLNRLSWQAQTVYMMTIPHLDRDGLIIGEPLLLMAQVAPLRAAELVSVMADLIQEWIAAELVLLYHDSDNGQPVLFFKNQELGIRYTRETPSAFAPPPGYERTPEGLVLVDVDTIAPAPDTAPVTQDELATDSGNGHPCDLTYLAEKLHEQLEATQQLGRRDEREYIRNTMKSSAYLWVDQVMRTLNNITDDIGWPEGSLLEVNS
jgi:hypothetical protein